MSLFEGDLVIFHDDPFLLEDSSVSQIASPPRGLSHLPVEFRAPNCPHKLTKTAEPWLGGGAALSGSELHAAVTSAAVRSRRGALVAAAAAPSVGGRHGRRSLQLRVIALGGCKITAIHHRQHLSYSPRYVASCSRSILQPPRGFHLFLLVAARASTAENRETISPACRWSRSPGE